MNAEATGLIEEGGRVVGVRATVEGKPEEIRADLVVGADGRHSTVRESAGFAPVVLGAPMDVLWFRLGHKPGDSAETMGRFDRGSILVMLESRRLLAVRLRHRQGLGRHAEGCRHREVPRSASPA